MDESISRSMNVVKMRRTGYFVMKICVKWGMDSIFNDLFRMQLYLLSTAKESFYDEDANGGNPAKEDDQKRAQCHKDQNQWEYKK